MTGLCTDMVTGPDYRTICVLHINPNSRSSFPTCPARAFGKAPKVTESEFRGVVFSAGIAIGE